MKTTQGRFAVVVHTGRNSWGSVGWVDGGCCNLVTSETPNLTHGINCWRPKHHNNFRYSPLVLDTRGATARHTAQ